MTMKPQDEPAFPVVVTDAKPVFPGMSLGDWFAGQAILGLLANSRQLPAGTTSQKLAWSAYELADAMLLERQRRAK